MSADGITALDADAPRDPVALRDLLARNLHRLRGSATHEEIARAARRHGLDWTSTWVSGAERGQRPITAEQLLALLIVLTDVVGHRVSLADLLFGDEPVLLTKPTDSYAPAASVSAAYLREVLTAPPSHRAFTTPGPPSAGDDGAVGRAAGKMREISRAGLGDVDVRDLARAETGAGDLEEKLARRLGVAPIVVIAAAAGLWGRSLTEERAARLSPDPYAETDTAGPRPAAIMRRLTADIAGRLAEAEAAARAAEQAAEQAAEEAERTAARATEEAARATDDEPDPTAVPSALALGAGSGGYDAGADPAAVGAVGAPDAAGPGAAVEHAPV